MTSPETFDPHTFKKSHSVSEGPSDHKSKKHHHHQHFTVRDSNLPLNLLGDIFLFGTKEYGDVVVDRKYIESDSSVWWLTISSASEPALHESLE